MSKFVYVNGYRINKDIVARVQYPYRDKEYGTIYFKDGTYTKASPYALDSVTGENQIVQVFPCPKGIVAIYEDDNEIFEEDVFFLALCEDGQIVPITLAGGCFEPVSVDNFKGLYPKYETCRAVDKREWDDISIHLGFELKGEKQ